MKYFAFILFPLSCQFFSCEQKMKVIGDLEFSNSATTAVFDWDVIKQNFPNRDILVFNFSDKGRPLNKIDDLPKVKGEFLNSLLEQVAYYRDWNEHLEIYYFSLNIIDNEKVGIFLSVRDFDGMEYNFDLIQFDDSGKVLVFHTIATSWETAECFGFTSAKIDLKDNILFSKTTQSCFDFESEERIIEESTSKYKLEGLKFVELKEK